MRVKKIVYFNNSEVQKNSLKSFEWNHPSTRTAWLAWVWATVKCSAQICVSLQGKLWARPTANHCGPVPYFWFVGPMVLLSVPVLDLHQKKTWHWTFLNSFQHKCSIKKAELTTEISSSLELVLPEWSCSVQWLEWLNEWSLELERCFSSCPCFLFSVDFMLCSNVDLRLARGPAEGLWCMTFPIRAKRGDLLLQTCPIYLQQTAEFWGI